MSEFWDFSLQFYRRPGIAETCIALQDRCGADVNLLLYALWAATRGHELDAAAMAEIDAMVRPWRETVVGPIRSARRAMKANWHGFEPGEVEALRERVLGVELEMEHLQQNAMALCLRGGTGPASLAAARNNIARYETLLGTPLREEAIAKLLHSFEQFCLAKA